MLKEWLLIKKKKVRSVRKLVKKVKFDFLREGNIGCCHIEADCNTVEDLKEALEFAQEASQLIPPIGITVNQKKQIVNDCVNNMP